ncbi:MAG: FAD-dependent oxidoreductase [Candidatus Thorarchaeota archaeon]
MSEELNWELIVVGGGPAGMTAAIYAARYGLKTLLLESRVLGGAQATSPAIENYPGFDWIQGIELAEKMKAQVRKSGVTIREITEVHKIRRTEDGTGFLLETRRGTYRAGAVILATGGGHRKLNVPGEELLTGRGVSYCATCDGPLFKNKTVAVIGGGNTAATEALYLSEVASSVYLIHRRDQLRAEKALQDLLFSSPVKILWNKRVVEFKGDSVLERLILEDTKTGERSDLQVDAAFVALGSDPESRLAKEIGVMTNERGEVIVDSHQRTNVAGVFAAGDVTESMKQIVVAAGTGAIAADSAYAYLRGMDLRPR